jgi:sugar/nucleoside kinase (ribokinase family)
MTDGPRGVHTSDGVRIYTAGIFENKQLVSRAGAGDAFGSGFVAGLMDREDIAYAMRFASANATSVTEHMGTHEGVLTRAQFVKDARWKKLNITAS